MRTNSAILPRSSAACKVREMLVPLLSRWVDSDGYGQLIPSFGGINYDVMIGDPCEGMLGGMLAPGVTVEGATSALRTYACVGNEVTVTSGEARGAKGFFTGKAYSNGPSHVYFPSDVLEKMSGEERFCVRCHGVGLALLDYPQLQIMNIDPLLFDKLGIAEIDGALTVPVTHSVPSFIIGDGFGTNPITGDVDISTDDMECYVKYRLSTLRYGDIVLIENLDCTHFISYTEGSSTVGIVVHGNAPGQGMGIGVMPIMSCRTPLLTPVISDNANIANYLGISVRRRTC